MAYVIYMHTWTEYRKNRFFCYSRFAIFAAHGEGRIQFVEYRLNTDFGVNLYLVLGLLDAVKDYLGLLL
jgi:hypothetical protein